MNGAIITLGIGADPEGVTPFVLVGLSPNVFQVREKSLAPLVGMFGAALLNAPLGGTIAAMLPTSAVASQYGVRQVAAAVVSHDGTQSPSSPRSGHRSKLTYAN